MKYEEQFQRVREVITELSQPLPDDEKENGWCADSQFAMLTYFTDIESTLSAKKSLPRHIATLARGLDHWGIYKGPLFRKLVDLADTLARK